MSVLTESQLLVDSHHGIYVPKIFVETYPAITKQLNVSEPDSVILQDPDHEYYWDTWADLLDYSDTEFKDQHGNEWTLEQIEGDLFAQRYVEPDGWCCADCVQMIANGELPPDCTDEQAEELGEISTEWCLLGDVGDESSVDEFSWQSCDTCSSSLAGERHALAFIPREEPKP